MRMYPAGGCGRRGQIERPRTSTGAVYPDHVGRATGFCADGGTAGPGLQQRHVARPPKPPEVWGRAHLVMRKRTRRGGKAP